MFGRCLVASCLMVLASSALADAPQQLPETIVKLLRANNIPESSMGVALLRLPDGAPVISHEAGRSMQPASTMKLLTSIVGLEKLGPAYRAKTELATAAPLENGVLRGDLVLRGGGDVDLDWEAFRRLLYTARRKGVEEISGDLILDRELFQPPRADLGVPPFDESPEFRYNVIPDALLLNFNLLQFDFVSDASGLTITMTPALDRVSIDSDLMLVDRPCEKWEDGWKIPGYVKNADGTIHIQLKGEFPRNCATTTHLNILDRVDFADRMFRIFWRDLGGRFSGRVRDGASPAGTRVLADHRGRPLAEVARDINKRSDNTMTRIVYLMLGVTSKETAGSTAARGEREIRAWLAAHGIADEGIVLENGSGLSRTERIQPAQLAAVLVAAYRSDWAPEYQSSLPIVAVDGSMRLRLAGSPAAAKARIKTGSLRDVAAVAGYVKDAEGKSYAVAAMINDPRAVGRVARPILDALLDWIAKNRF